MSTEQQLESAETEVNSTIGNAKFSKGKWFCECHIEARCRTATKNSIHKGKKFWRCANADNRQCSFFLWVVHEAAAKEWLKVSQPDSNFQSPMKLPQHTNRIEPTAETPKKVEGSGRDDLEIETPFTKAKKRRKVPTDDTKFNAGDSVTDQGSTGDRDPFITSVAPETPNKTIKVSILSTPSQRFAEMLQIGTSTLSGSNLDQIPSTSNAERTAPELDALPISARGKSIANPSLRGDSSLTSAVLDLIRSDNVELKPSTEIQIRHEIDLAVDVGRARVQRYQETISKRHERIDELERMILHLTE